MSFTHEIFGRLAAHQKTPLTKLKAEFERAGKVPDFDFDKMLAAEFKHPEEAACQIQSFKDTLFALIMLRVRNHMKHYEDYPDERDPEEKNPANFDLKLTFKTKAIDGAKLAPFVTIFPNLVISSDSDGEGGLPLGDLAQILQNSNLPCE